MDQDEAFFYLMTKHQKEKILLHDYGKIYDIPQLYEQLFYKRLKCCSPEKVAQVLKHTIEVSNDYFSTMKVLDFGAGNGMMGEELKNIGVARLVGVDILEEARNATERDRPGVYDEYYVKDFTDLTDTDIRDVKSWNLNALITVAALGFNDIPPQSFVQALNLIDQEGWVAFNIKETFLYNKDTTGFSKLIRELIFSEFLNIHHLERYRHRISIDGDPLYYFVVTCRKKDNIPYDFLEKKGIL
ncbi:class I SAM-dependent DNA methyltransferase [Chloroflexota bacterium]